MPYIDRDSNGNITGLYAKPQRPGHEFVEDAQIYVNQITSLQSQIDSIESATHMNRFVREAMILISQQQAAALGMTEPQLYLANIGYMRVKDVDTQIISLRAQIAALGG